MKRSDGTETRGDESSAPPPVPALCEVEPFEYEVRIVALPENGPPKVWKTRSVKADLASIYILPPLEWRSRVPGHPVTLYFMTETASAELDALVQTHRADGEELLRIDRPPELEWKTKDAVVSQKRKFRRVDVSLPCHLSVIIPTISGSALKLGESHEGRLTDLSVDGCSVLTDFEPPVERRIDIEVLGPGFPLTIRGKVIRVIPSPNPIFRFSAAVAFQDMGEVTKDMLAQYISSKQREER